MSDSVRRVEFKVFELGPIGTNAILAFDREQGNAVVFDAPGDAFEVVNGFAQENGLKIEALLLTHGHWDHMLDAHLFEKAGVPAYAHADDRLFFEKPEIMASYSMPGIEFVAVEIDGWLTPRENIDYLGESWQVRHVPGHCPGSLLFYSAQSDAAIVGDAIFAGSIGRVDLPGGDFTTLEKSIRTQIYTLPDDTTLFPGHGPKTSVRIEKASNPYVNA